MIRRILHATIISAFRHGLQKRKLRGKNKLSHNPATYIRAKTYGRPRLARGNVRQIGCGEHTKC